MPEKASSRNSDLGSDMDLEQPLLANENEHGGVDDHVRHETEEIVAAPVASNIIRAEDVEIVVETNTTAVSSTPMAPFAASSGQWKDGLCNCCVHGCCHPSLICSWCCPLIAISQVMRRMNLIFTGRQGTNIQSKITYLVLLAVSLLYFFNGPRHLSGKYGGSGGNDSNRFNDDDGSNSPSSFILPTSLTTMMIHFVFPYSVYSFLVVYLVWVTRSFIRRRYNIPERSCAGCEDCCVACAFPCCAISQMARHTTDYDLYRAAWCSDTGLPAGVPSIV